MFPLGSGPGYRRRMRQLVRFREALLLSAVAACSGGDLGADAASSSTVTATINDTRLSAHRRPELCQIHDLVAADFERHSVWIGIEGLDEAEPWYDGDGLDEANVRPWLGSMPVDTDNCTLFVATDFVCADGTRWRGYVTFGCLEDRKAVVLS